MQKFQNLLLNSRIKHLEDTRQFQKRDENVENLQKSVDEISSIWKKIKKMKNQVVSSE